VSGLRQVAGRLPFVLLLMLGGCSGFHSSVPAVQTYYLRAPAAAPTEAAAGTTLPLNVSVRVAHPIADPGLDSPHIMLARTDQRLDFYTASGWAGPVPEVIGSLAVQTLESSGAFASVREPRSPFPAEYLLQIVVRHFEADYTSGAAAPRVQVLLDCTLGTSEGRDVIATFAASGSSPAAANHLNDVVAAFQQATGTALTALSRQTFAALASASSRTAQETPAATPASTPPSR